MIFPHEPGGIIVQPDGRIVCCLMQADRLSPAKFLANAQALRTTTLSKKAIPVVLENQSAGEITKLQFGGEAGCLFAYGYLNDSFDAAVLDSCLAIAEFSPQGVLCGVCGTLSNAQTRVQCECLERSACLILKSICIERVLFYRRWNEDSKEAGSRAAFLSAQFTDAIATMQIVDPL